MEYSNFIDQLKSHRQALKDIREKFLVTMTNDVTETLKNNGFLYTDDGWLSDKKVSILFFISPSSYDPYIFFRIRKINAGRCHESYPGFECDDERTFTYKCKEPISDYFTKKLLPIINELKK